MAGGDTDFMHSFQHMFGVRAKSPSTAFSSLAQARAVLATWRDDYKRVRPHSVLANRTPGAFCNPT